MSCPLCHHTTAIPFGSDKCRSYLQCPHCDLVYVPKSFHLSTEQEKAEYDQHQNDPNDLGYRRFLSRAVEPLHQKLEAQASASEGLRGLDFGCGPGPTVSVMFQEKGIQVHNYDVYYFPDPMVLQTTYDFVILTEVLEHLSDPAAAFTLFQSLLKPHGTLAIMTKRVLSYEAFQKWHYKNDPTHIGFYSIACFEWIAQHLGWNLEVVDTDVVFLTQT